MYDFKIGLTFLLFMLFLLFNSDNNFLEKLNYRFNRTKSCPEAIEDIYDGELYQMLFKEGSFLYDPNNLSFLANTDGVAIVRSSGASVWPVYLTINELLPLERYINVFYDVLK